jgi:hypothetical protein
MKKILSAALISGFMLTSFVACAQKDKSKRPSPPAKITQKIESGATISIDYSQPSVKGRTIGKDLEPMEGQVWRTGANEATVFETDKDILINGNKLPAGKYALFTIHKEPYWTVIFSKKWNQWGAFKYNEADDALRVDVKTYTPKEFSEKMTFNVSPTGVVSLAWGNTGFAFEIQEAQ